MLAVADALRYDSPLDGPDKGDSKVHSCKHFGCVTFKRVKECEQCRGPVVSLIVCDDLPESIEDEVIGEQDVAQLE